MKNVQIERRRQRAREERFEIQNLGDEAIYSKFRVLSGSDNVYVVTIRDLSAPGANACTCPDFLVNQLGTCKHIEAVNNYLKQIEPSQYRRAKLTPPPKAYIFLNYGETVVVEARRPLRPTPRLAGLINSHFDFQGRFRGDPVSHFQEFEDDLAKLSSSERASLKIADDVREYIQYQRLSRKRRLEHSRYLTRIDSGRVKFEPLLEPLYPYQIRGALHLAFHQRAMLADEIGLGKTVQAIAAARFLIERGDIQNCLIVCPASLKRQWLREIERFTGQSAVIIEGRNREEIYTRRNRRFYIASYELVLRDRKQMIELAPDLIVLDEAQRIKNWRTRTAQAVKDIPCSAAFVLTGAPIETDLEALYSIVQFLDQRKLGPLWRYYELYFRFDGRGRHIGYRNLDELKKRLEDSYLRRTKESVVSELPDLIESFYAAEFAEPQREIYQRARQQIIGLLELAGCAQLDADQRRELDDQIELLRRAANAPKSQGKFSPKLEEARAIFEETVLLGGRKAVVFASDRAMTTAACELLDDMDISYIHFHGGIPHDQRAETVQAFTANESCRVFVATDLGSVGLNLQVADVVINLDHPLSENRRSQRLGRVYRLGRQEPVNLIHIVGEDSFEESLFSLSTIDRNLLSRYAEADTTRGPLELSLEIKGRTIRDSLAELLTTAAATGLPFRRRTERPTASNKDQLTIDESSRQRLQPGKISPDALPISNHTDHEPGHEPDHEIAGEQTQPHSSRVQGRENDKPVVDLFLAPPKSNPGLFDQFSLPRPGAKRDNKSVTNLKAGATATNFARQGHDGSGRKDQLQSLESRGPESRESGSRDKDLEALRACLGTEAAGSEIAQVVRLNATKILVLTSYPRQVQLKVRELDSSLQAQLQICQPIQSGQTAKNTRTEAKIQWNVAQSLIGAGFQREALQRLRDSLCVDWDCLVEAFAQQIVKRQITQKLTLAQSQSLALLHLFCQSAESPGRDFVTTINQVTAQLLEIEVSHLKG